jgi:hypothetical protein
MITSQLTALQRAQRRKYIVDRLKILRSKKKVIKLFYRNWWYYFLANESPGKQLEFEEIVW